MIEISLGQRLHELRDKADSSLRELARKVGISSGTGNLKVFANKRSHRDEKSFDVIGKYDSFATEQNFKLGLDRVDYWMTNALKK
jgi:ribosomal protein S16